MTLWQRRLFRRRQPDRASNSELIQTRIGSLTQEQVTAVCQVVQRVIDGRVAILADSATLSTENIHEMRGGISALTEFSRGLYNYWQDCREEGGADA